MTEKTFLMIKPDGVARGLVGKVISRVEMNGLKITAAKMILVDDALARKHYEEHIEKDFFERLLSFITSSPSIAMVVEGEDAIQIVRTLVGKTDPKEAKPLTIRGDFGLSTPNNIVHASDSKKSAKREIALFFDPSEIFEYDQSDEGWIYGD
ncbi:MAG: nucleoside-diphosphate kinase [Candidatus Hydrothermarchaeales archaeon]